MTYKFVSLVKVSYSSHLVVVLCTAAQSTVAVSCCGMQASLSAGGPWSATVWRAIQLVPGG